MFTFESKTALVIGAGQNIGRAIALEFARRGARVAVADIGKQGAEEIDAEHSFPFGGGKVFRVTGVDDACIVHLDVDITQKPFGLTHSFTHRALIRHVTSDAGRFAARSIDQSRRFVGACLADIRYGNARPTTGKLQSDATTDILAGPDDQGILIFKSEHALSRYVGWCLR